MITDRNLIFVQSAKSRDLQAAVYFFLDFFVPLLLLSPSPKNLTKSLERLILL